MRNAAATILGLGLIFVGSTTALALIKSENEPAPTVTVTVTPSPAPTVTLRPEPAPTVTVTTRGISPECQRVVTLVLEMKEANYNTSSEFADAKLILDAAARALAMGDQNELNKQLGKLQKNDEDLSGPARRLVELDIELEKAMKRCDS